ncbi:MAG: mRNA-degrading endonuclease RelE of RelBE toxin-antitoxin system [Candidatus Woesearchaeota archaeon]|jgi:mRNA-degrading endonuclease RelE of RelBE toxin-antitoxin system
MNTYRVYVFPTVHKNLHKFLSPNEKEEFWKLISILEKGQIVGKILTYHFFREKKIGNKRIYYLIYREYHIVLIVNVSAKKAQQKIIDEVKKTLPEFKKFAEKIAI